MAQRKILIVDDEQNILDVVKAYLEKDGYEVLAAADGETALKIFQYETVHLVVLDLMLKVRDNGIGITEVDLPHIFERFYRSDLSRSKDTGGAGIGLTITKALVEAQGGRIYADSSPSKGTVFMVTFPIGSLEFKVNGK